MTILEKAPVLATTSWPQARLLAYEAPVPLPPLRVGLSAAAGLTLAEDLLSLGPLPAFATSAMDGYAVAGEGPYCVVGQVRAGGMWAGTLAPGEAVSISTGAPVPAGATAVLRLEAATVDGDRLVGPSLEPGQHIRAAGEDAPAGACLAPAGLGVRPALLGLAATAGHDHLLVRPRPSVTVLVTGDELLQAGVSGGGMVRDALGPMLPGLLAELGGDVHAVRHVVDRPGSLAEAVGASEAAVIVVSGSTSVGTTDQLRPLLRGLGARLVVDTVACRPGHPQLLAELPTGQWLVGLPGNPFAAFVAVRTLVEPLLAGLAGRRLATLPVVPVFGDVGRGRGTRLVPVVWAGAGAQVLDRHQAAFLCGAALSDAIAALPEGWVSGDPAPLLLN